MVKHAGDKPFNTALARTRLLRWYGREKRALPWRGASDPYRIWVSEIMLQQTRVEAVIPYYNNFLRQFPTVAALAKAPLERVLAAWSGLGYYSRARNLHQAAKRVVAEHAGKFPREEPAALALPGVGRYTAAAILSIAYGVPLAVLDGNVARVLSRLQMLKAEVRDTRGKAMLWKAAQEFLDTRCPGDFNQAMMELGATVCLPGKPACGECPLRLNCRARLAGVVEEYPPVRARAAETLLALVGAIVRDRAGRYLLEQRPRDASWMGGFWQIPTWGAANASDPSDPGDADATGAAHQHRSGIRERIATGRSLGSIRHGITRYRIEVEVKEAALADAAGFVRETQALRWASRAEMDQLPVTTITRKAIRIEQGRMKETR